MGPTRRDPDAVLRALLPVLAIIGAVGTTVAAADTRPGTVDVLKAETVVKQIRVHDQGADIRYTLDENREDKAGDKLESGQVFVTRKTLKVTFQELNPLLRRVSVKVKGVDNASKDLLAKLVDALAGIPSTLKPSLATTDGIKAVVAPRASTGGGDCSAEIGKALAYVSTLDALLFSDVTSAERLKTEYNDKWAGAIAKGFGDGKSGAGAIADGVTAIKEYEDSLRDQVSQAAKAIDFVDQSAASKPPAQCDQYATAVYQFIHLTQPHIRLGQLRKLLQTIDDLQSTLTKNYGQPVQWLGRDYIAAQDIVVTSDRDADVSLEVTTLAVNTSESSLAVKTGDAVSTAFTIQYDTGWVAEAGVGITSGFVTRPKFGTSKNAGGETIVAQTANDRVSVDPTVMVNFLRRAGGAAPILPMVQVGAAVSKETPAVFVGGGWRLFGGKTGGVAVGLGLMLAWTKELDKLSVGDVVSGTADIDADLKFDLQPKPRFYFSIEYKF